MPKLRRLSRLLARLLLGAVLASVLAVLALQVEGLAGQPGLDAALDHQRAARRPWTALADDLKMAVIAAEDQKFASHHGFDLDAIRAALAHNERGASLRGASTLSQQVAKNLFLWSGRSWTRKALEAWFTVLIEALWPKQRILEVYLNSAEWGHGVFGAEAAAQHHFAKSARHLSRHEASLLAAVLPNPRAWSAGRPSAYVSRRANWIRQQIGQLGGSRYLQRL